MSELSLKQKTFCDEYLVDMNAAKAAIRAGYSERSAEVIGYENLRKPSIQEYISQKVKERNARTELDQDKTVKEYAKVAFFDYRKLFDSNGQLIPIDQLDAETASCITSFEVTPDSNGVLQYKYKIGDKMAAMNCLAKHQNLFAEDNKKELELKGELTHNFTSKEVARRIAFVLAKGLRQDE